MRHVRSYTRRPPARPAAFMEKCEQLLADLWLEREWRALEACEYALPVLERDLSEIIERDVLDDPPVQRPVA
ncbi:MAG: hypothetical protein KF810_17060 [Rhizobiaceae bacterium]|nr:hypothetical protein [Rhizobiaceae bacterium]